MVGVKCCTYLPDYNASLSDLIEQLKNITEEVRNNDLSNLFDWLEIFNWPFWSEHDPTCLCWNDLFYFCCYYYYLY